MHSAVLIIAYFPVPLHCVFISLTCGPLSSPSTALVHQGEQITEAIVSNVNGIMSKRKMQEEAVQTEDSYMTTEEVQAQLLLVKDDVLASLCIWPQCVYSLHSSCT